MKSSTQLPSKSRFVGWLLRLPRAFAIAVGLCVLILFFFQDVLLWHPRPYPAGQVENFPRALTALEFRTSQGKQAAFYAPPLDRRTLPSALWVLFAGNGSLALDWQVLVESDVDPGRAFLFIDYPGYGRCEGKPSPASIAQNTAGAMNVLARRLGQNDEVTLERTVAASGRLALAAHSMGTGAALEYAARCPSVSRVVLVAPFTSLRAMARRTLGWPLCWLLRGDFDNQARLDELARNGIPSRVLVLHGERDSLIPPAMGRALAAAHPGFVHFEPIAGADHDDVVATARVRLLAALDER